MRISHRKVHSGFLSCGSPVISEWITWVAPVPLRAATQKAAAHIEPPRVGESRSGDRVQLDGCSDRTIPPES